MTRTAASCCTGCDSATVRLERLKEHGYLTDEGRRTVPRFSFQVRTGDATLGHGAALEFDSLNQALDVAMRTMIGQALRL